MDPHQETPIHRRTGRPKTADEARHAGIIRVWVSPAEYTALRVKAAAYATTPAGWLRTAALSRCLPPPQVPAINQDAYAELRLLAAHLDQLARQARVGNGVVVDDALLEATIAELAMLRNALLGMEDDDDGQGD